MQYARCASGFSCMPWRKNRSGSFQMAPLLLLNAEADGYHWKIYVHWLQFLPEHLPLWYPVFWNKSVPKQGSRHQIPFSRRSVYLLLYIYSHLHQTIPGNLPVFPLFPWSQEVSYEKEHDPDPPDPSPVPGSKVWLFYLR